MFVWSSCWEVDPIGAKKEVLDAANKLGLDVVVAVAYEVLKPGLGSSLLGEGSKTMEGGASTYLGAAPIVHCLEKYKPHVVITSRVADAALFLAPMVYELGWNWNDFKQLAQGSLAAHLLECGCQLTGGYFMHPGDEYRDISFEKLLDLSLPYAVISYEGEVFVAKTVGSGGILNYNTCAEQLLYEVGDPSAYITPDVVVDFQDVYFKSLSEDIVSCKGAKPSETALPDRLLQLVPLEYGWKAWGEISYGGRGCLKRAEAAEFLVRSWMDETYPGTKDCLSSYIIGYNSLKIGIADIHNLSEKQTLDIRLRMDGLFKQKEHAVHFSEEFMALYTNGPAGGGGICTGQKKEIILQKELVERQNVYWKTAMSQTKTTNQCSQNPICQDFNQIHSPREHSHTFDIPKDNSFDEINSSALTSAAPSGKRIPLYEVAHSRAGDKGNDLNFSIIPHFPRDIDRLKMVITPNWVKNIVSHLLDTSCFPSPEAIEHRNTLLDQVNIELYEAKGINSLNVVVRNILDGGVNCSRRIDRHGKTLSDLVLCQEIMLPE
ncbi:Acyclic terpene utilization protein [Dioscorea alata]|uniref:Acyclic terpene utilization protein n=1 Tax=Dioscorea alata TaxID=55571 RepID=A0ACB7WRS5_DIOAL|nr:Acyclic terpene utilization protein [Dioscorea alata]